MHGENLNLKLYG